MVWLVAEDEADIRILITTMIKVWGHSAVAYENGQKVWDWLDKLDSGELTPVPPDLVLMDIRMPGKKGNELAARMRRVSAFAQTPIILMTAFSMNDAERKEIIERDGVDRIIQKPLPEFEQLRKLLHDAIDERKTAPPLAPNVPEPEAKPAAPETPVVQPEDSATKPETPEPESLEASKASVPKSL
ncbi:MAG TPA: response regulator [Candidatus Limnocylindrales bacterium]|nr:response regulator [Candidatus Limnocylindrales bacterium]